MGQERKTAIDREGEDLMFRTVRTGLLPVIALGLIAVGGQAQTASKTATAPGSDAAATAGGAPAQAGAAGSAAAGADVVLATVTSHNRTDKVTRAEVINFLSRNPLPPSEEREAAYQTAVNMLVNTALLNQFLSRQNVPVTPAKVDEEIEKLKQQLKAEGQDLPTMLNQNGLALEEIRKVFENRLRWQEYVKFRATDATLRKFLNDNRDLFSGTQVRASHIFLKVEPNASAADKEKVKQKLLGIRNDILQNKISFAAAANKYSQDQANEGGAGGDLDYFTLQSGYIEEFANHAFKMKKGEISGPVETPYGYHLIQITDRKEGKLPDFEQNKPAIIQAYAADLQKNVLDAERKTAQIEIKPMPKDLFPPEPPATGAGATATATPAAAPAPGAAATPRP
jgi:peptidyl-prolyl cis-trans isomerase C